MKRTYTIAVDTRERKPLPFPAYLPVMVDPIRRTRTSVGLKTLRTKLETGDYHIVGAERAVVIERKASIDEVAKNVLTSVGRRRFTAELKRLNDCCQWPYIMFEGTPTQLSKPTKRNPDPYLAVDSLIDLMLGYNVPLLMLPSGSVAARRRFGEFAARLLVRGALLLEE
jgi:ERCC4-type nuclease